MNHDAYRYTFNEKTSLTEVRDSKDNASSRGELRAEWRERHLCLRCDHHFVCKMATALDANLLVVIAQCLAFQPANDGRTR